MRALVTGGGGFLGRAIIRQLLDRGAQVRLLARGAYPDLEQAGVQCKRGSIAHAPTLSEACRGMDVVFHVAALAALWGRHSDFVEVNIRGTENLLGSCYEHGIKRLVYTSSPSVVFGMQDLAGVDEATPYPTRYYADYPQTKAMAERLVLAANGQHGLATCSLRPHLIWGPGDTHIIPLIAERARRGQLVRIGDGKNLVDLTFVEHAAMAHLLAAERLNLDSPVAGKAYFISDGAPVNLWDWVAELLRRLDLPPVRRQLSYNAAYSIATILETAWRWLPLPGEPRLTRFAVSNFAKTHYFDLSAARRDLAYAPTISNEEGLRRTVEWWKGRKE